jgi:hypothetical protein
MILTVTPPVLTTAAIAAPATMSDGCSHHQSDDCNLETIPKRKKECFSRKSGAIFNLGKQNIVFYVEVPRMDINKRREAIVIRQFHPKEWD